MSVALQLAQLLFGVGIVLSLVRALMPRGSATEAQWARRRAEWLSVSLGLVVTYLVLVVVRALVRADPRGIIPFLTLAAVVGVAFLVLRAVWRRAIRASAAETEAASPSEPEEPRRHRGLSGEETPPTRW